LFFLCLLSCLLFYFLFFFYFGVIAFGNIAFGMFLIQKVRIEFFIGDRIQQKFLDIIKMKAYFPADILFSLQPNQALACLYIFNNKVAIAIKLPPLVL